MNLFQSRKEGEKTMARDSSNQNYVRSIIKDELMIDDIKEEPEDLTSTTSVKFTIKEELDIQDFKEELRIDYLNNVAFPVTVNLNTSAFCVQSTSKEELKNQGVKKEFEYSTTPETYMQSIINEELILEDFKEEPYLTSSPEKISNNDKRRREDMFTDTPEFAVVDNLQINNQIEYKSKIKDKTLTKKQISTSNVSTSGSMSAECPTVSRKSNKISVVQYAGKGSSASNEAFTSKELPGFSTSGSLSTECPSVSRTSAPGSSEASTSKKLPKSSIVNNFDTAVQEFGRTYCSKCRKHQQVMYRKARCCKCKTILRYDCWLCGSSYKSFTELGKHLKGKHVMASKADKIYECDNCHKIFSVVKRFNEHRGGCTGKSAFPCQYCSYVAKFKSNLTAHVKSAHRNFEASCPNCDRCYTNERSYKRHLKVYCGKGKPFGCHHCGVRVYRKDQILDHLKFRHPEVFRY